MNRRVGIAQRDAEIARLIAEVERLESRHQVHLVLIRRLSTESISSDEAVEMQKQIAALMAEVGTQRGYVRELLEQLEGT